MGELNKQKLEKYAKGDTLIETGTYHGYTVRIALDYGFKKVHTIEIQPHLAERVKKNYSTTQGVFIYNGDSPDILRDLCPSLNTPCTFWLDGHRSGGDTGESQKYGWSPLLAELAAIALSPCKDHVIYIDDIRDCGSFGWPSKEEVIGAIMNINPLYNIYYLDGYDTHHPNDILVATID